MKCVLDISITLCSKGLCLLIGVLFERLVNSSSFKTLKLLVAYFVHF